MQPKLRLHFFGAPQFTYQDVPLIGFVSNKARALLVYLAVTGRPHSRDVLEELLWGDKPTTARDNLKKALSSLRKLSGVTLIEEGWHLVALDRESCLLDVTEFTKACDAASDNTNPLDDPQTLESTVALYQADFLAGFNTSLSIEFEEWALSTQAQLKVQMVTLLHRLANIYEQRNELDATVTTLQKLLHFEPWHEDVHRRLIELLAINNDATAALDHFENCKKSLRDELDIDPSPATVDLVAQIRDGSFHAAQPSRSASSRRTSALSEKLPGQKPLRQKQTKTEIEFPLVGRDKEWQLIQEQWQELNGAHFICIGGEAGIGKTRLAEELLVQAETEGTSVARTRSHELQGQLAYGPIADWLRTPPLQAALAQLDNVWLTEIARLQPELLVDGLEPPQPLKEGWQRKRFFDALAHAFNSVKGPLLLVLDDLQWSDVDTLEWLQFLVESTTAELMVVGTARLNEIAPEHPLHRVRHQLQRQGKFIQLRLSALTPEETSKLAVAVTARQGHNQIAQSHTEEAQRFTKVFEKEPTSSSVTRLMPENGTGDSGHPLADASTECLFRDTAGNPLFVIESMRANPAEGGATEPSSIENDTTDPFFSPYPKLEPEENSFALSMPTKMYSVIQSRLARLSPSAQKMAQLGAAIGRAFDVPLMAQAGDSDEKTVLMILDELWEQRIIKEIDALHFDFSHDRIRDVAYAEIGPIKRRLLHRNVAEALEQSSNGKTESVAGQLAVHYEAAGLVEQAISFYRQAADEAGRLYAYQDAVKYREQAVSLHRQRAKTVEAQQLEISLLLDIFQDRTIADGKGASNIWPYLQDANGLAQDVGTALQKILVLNALTVYARVRGEWYRAYELASQTVAAAERLGDPDRLNYARFGIASALMRRGHIEEAITRLEDVHSSGFNKYRTMTGAALNRSAYSLWLFGYPDRACKRGLKGVTISRTTGDSPEIPLHHCSSIHVFCGDVQTVDELSAELVELTTRRGDDFSLRWGLIYRGWILVQQGQLQEGIALMRENADEHRSRGNYFYECIWRSLLADAYILAGDFDAAFTEIDETLAYSEKSGDVHWNAQLLKQRGDCLLASGGSDSEVECAYQDAIDTARDQGSRSLELRATTSLCRLWQRQGKCQEAHQMLSTIHGWFTEGFGTADLIEAKTVLDMLELALSVGETPSVDTPSVDTPPREYA